MNIGAPKVLTTDVNPWRAWPSSDEISAVAVGTFGPRLGGGGRCKPLLCELAGAQDVDGVALGAAGVAAKVPGHFGVGL